MTQTAIIQRGDVVRVDHSVARVVDFQRGPQGLSVVMDVNGELRSLDLRDFLESAEVLSTPAQRPDALALPTAWLWHSLEPNEREALNTRARDLLQVITGSRRGLPELDCVEGNLDPRYDPAQTTQLDRMRRMSEDLKARGSAPWSVSQLYRQAADFQRDGMLGLIHGNRRVPLGMPDLPDDVRVALESFLEEQPTRPRVEHGVLAALAQARLWEAGININFTADELETILGELTRGRALHREAKSRRNRTAVVGRSYGSLMASRPGEIVQVDATETTMHPWFPHVGRAKAYILTGIDVYTRMVVACRVVANVPCSRDVAMLLWDMGRPQITRAGWPFEYQLIRGLPRFVAIAGGPEGARIRPPDPLGGKLGCQPTFVVLDHGRENESLHLINAAVRNGINLIYCPPGAGWTKGIVESVHRVIDTVQSLFLDSGYKGASVANHPRQADGQECLTVGDLQDALWSFFLTTYNNTEHTGLRDPLNPALRPTPQQVLENYLTVMGSVALPTDPWRVVDFLSSEPRKLEDYGINLNGLVYQSDELMDLHSVVQPGIGRAGHLIDVRFDRYDLSRVFVQHPLTRQWLCVPLAGGAGRTVAPLGEALFQAAVASADAGRRGLTETQRVQALAELAMAWSRGVFEDRRQQRLAAFEATRRQSWAHDLEDATPQYRALVGGVHPVHFDEPDEEEEDVVDLTEFGLGWQEAAE